MRRGFTLVELAIVLVIIGLLIGGILVAVSMIETARVQTTVKSFQQYDAAIANFKTRYNGLPGDSSKMGCTNGGANQNICDNNLITSLDVMIVWANSPGMGQSFNAETGRAWNNLQNSGFKYSSTLTVSSITDPTNTAAMKQSFPVLKVSRDAFVSINSCLNSYGRDTCYQLTGVDNGSLVPVMTSSFAYAFDTKIDDGMPLSGNAQNWQGQDNPGFLVNDQCDNGLDNSNNMVPIEESVYMPGNSGINCYMEVRILSDQSAVTR